MMFTIHDALRNADFKKRWDREVLTHDEISARSFERRVEGVKKHARRDAERLKEMMLPVKVTGLSAVSFEPLSDDLSELEY